MALGWKYAPLSRHALPEKCLYGTEWRRRRIMDGMRLPAAIALLACLSCAVPSFAAPKHSLDSEHYRFFYDPDHLMGVDTVRKSAERAEGFFSPTAKNKGQRRRRIWIN